MSHASRHLTHQVTIGGVIIPVRPRHGCLGDRERCTCNRCLTYRSSRTRSERLRAAGPLPSVVRVLAAHGASCHLCGGSIDLDLPGTDPMGLTRDHVLALVKGGMNDLENVRPAHRVCNLRKGSA